MASSVIRILLSHAVDYAGVFPPAQLSLATAFSSYATDRAGDHAWMLGRFVLPAPRLPDFEELAASITADAAGTPCPLSVIVSADPVTAIGQVRRFNETWSDRARVAALEVAAVDSLDVSGLAREAPDELEVFVEVPTDADLEACLDAIRSAGAFAKIRTGGVTADAFPSDADLSRFMMVCARRRVAFKATAGLHHAVRGRYPLTYEPDSACAAMHGFLNVAVLAALIHANQVGDEEALEVLRNASAQAFTFSADGLAWRDRKISGAEVAEARRRFFTSFGSCSFREPVGDLQALGMI